MASTARLRKLHQDDEADASNEFAQSASDYLTDADSEILFLSEVCHTAVALGRPLPEPDNAHLSHLSDEQFNSRAIACSCQSKVSTANL